MPAQAGGYPFGGAPVPQRGAPPMRPVAGERARNGGGEGIWCNEAVRPLCKGDGAFGRVTQGEAWDVEIGRLLLHAARIRDDEARLPNQRHEVDVAQRLDDGDAGTFGYPRQKAEFLEPFACAGMHGEDEAERV